MNNVEKRASAHSPMARAWLERGESAGRTAVRAIEAVDGWLNRTFSGLVRAQARRAARRELYALDDRILADIGLRRDQVDACVDAMFRGTPAPAEPSASGVAPSEDVTEVNASNDNRYKSAA